MRQEEKRLVAKMTPLEGKKAIETCGRLHAEQARVVATPTARMPPGCCNGAVWRGGGETPKARPCIRPRCTNRRPRCKGAWTVRVASARKGDRIARIRRMVPGGTCAG